jgi:ABC-type enterochelin transport system substrate-binding protein
MKILVIKINGSLKPCYDSDYENFAKIPIGEQIEITYTKRRNLSFHKKYFALLKLCFENQSDYRLLEDMRRDLIITSGRYDEIVNKITGEVYKLANSISFGSMDENEFNQLYEDTKGIISKWLGVSDENIEEQILQYF